MITEQHLVNLTIAFDKGRSCILRLFILLSFPVFLLLFALLGFIGIINFHIEIHSVVMLSTIFIIYLFFMKHNAYFAACKLKKDFTSVKDKLTEYINKNLLEIAGIEKANASLDEFLIEETKHLRNENYSSIAAGIFPTLGILGTFISIAISMPDFSAQTSEVLEEEISKLLGGVGTAFYVSIYGIFLSIWWIFFEKSGMSGFDKDAKIIKASTKDYFWQKEEIEQTYFRKSMENFEKLNSVFDTFSSENFLKDLNDTLMQRVSVFENIIEHEQEGARKIAKIIDNSTVHLEKLYEEQRTLANSLHDITNQFKSFALNIQKQNDTFNEAQNALSSEFSRAVMMAEVLSENSVKIGDSLSAVNAKNVEKLYSDMLKNIEALGETFDSRMDKFDSRFLEKLQNTLHMIDSETAQIVSHLSKIDNR